VGPLAVGYPSRVLFRRKSSPALVDDAVASSVTESESEALARPRSWTPSKKELGKVTPKRKAAGRTVAPPPTTRREAARRLREKQRQHRMEAREGMRAGKQEYLFARDKGPDRALVRDIVDSRRNAATYFLPGALIVIFGTSAAMPPAVRFAANLFWFLLALAVIVDSVLLGRRVKRTLRERFPDEPVRRGTYWYAVMRSLSFRRIRMPAPRVKLGEKV
jgi:hypothetical protein